MMKYGSNSESYKKGKHIRNTLVPNKKFKKNVHRSEAFDKLTQKKKIIIRKVCIITQFNKLLLKAVELKDLPKENILYFMKYTVCRAIMLSQRSKEKKRLYP